MCVRRLSLALLHQCEAHLYRLTHNSDFPPTPAVTAIINNAPLRTHMQYYLHLSQHDTESIPLKVMVGCAKWTDCQASWKDIIYCAHKGVFSFQGKSPGNKTMSPFGYGAEKAVRTFSEGNDIILTMFSCLSGCLSAMYLTVRETFTPQSPTRAYLWLILLAAGD